MLSYANLQIISFFTGLALVSTSIIVAWDLVRSSMRGRNVRPLIFGAGVMVLVFSFFITDLNQAFSYPIWLYGLAAVGYVLLASALVLRRRDYLIYLTLLSLLIIPRNSLWFLLVTLPVLWIAHLAYQHFCIVSCTAKQSHSAKQDRDIADSWAAIIAFFAMLSASYFLLGYGFSATTLYYFLLLNIAIKATIVVIMCFLLFHFVKLDRRESLVFPIMLGFILVSTISVFFTTNLVNTFIQNEFKGDVRDSAYLTQYIVNQNYTNDQLVNRLENKSPELNDLADKIFIDTGIRVTFFLGDVRVAAAPSAINGDRNLGTKITDTNVVQTVLNNDKNYTGIVIKLGQPVAASYLPVEKDGQVIGMIATGKTLGGLTTLRSTLAFYIIGAGVLTMVIILGAVYFESRPNLKTGKHK